jgi:cytochrome c oxidase assembly factor CtaG
MVQHVLLVSVAAPLLAAGRPLAAVGLTWRRPRPRPWLVLALAGVVQVATLCAWHIPALYDAALRHDQVHALEHASLLLTAVAFWAALDSLGGEAAGAGVGALFVVTLPAMALGVAMTLARTPWYPAYAHTADPLADQQMAGVVMWAYAGLAAVLAGVILVVKWFGRLERRLPGSTVVVAPPIGTAPPC